MDQIQQDLESNYPELDIQIIGMNERGHEIGNAGITENRDLPWLQDVDSDNDGESDVWLGSWDYVYRDVVIVDANNEHVATFNVTEHDLSDPDNYAALMDLMVDAAEVESPDNPWQNPVAALDVDDDGWVVPLDALHILNELNSSGAYELNMSASSVPYYYDTSNDGFLTPLDALLILNHLNDPSSLKAEGEADVSSALPSSDAWGDHQVDTESDSKPSALVIDEWFAGDEERSKAELSLPTIDEPDQPLTIHRREDSTVEPLEL